MRGYKARRKAGRSCWLYPNIIIFFCAATALCSFWLFPDTHFGYPDDVLGQRPSGTQISRKPENSTIRFVLFLGIEGTGHHFWQDLVKESPAYSRLVDLGLSNSFAKRLTKNLYRHKKNRWEGLWSGVCKWNAADPSPNATFIQEDLAATLREMNQHVENQVVGDSRPLTVLFPVNFLSSGDEFGVASYPAFLKPCRALTYPNLDVWYDTCSMAGVLCEHVFITRNPYAVIKSTTMNRPINVDKVEAIHLYTTHLRILHSQMLTYPDRLIGCWDYDQVSSPTQWREEIEPLLQFGDESSFAQVLKRVFRPKSPLTQEEKQEIVPKEFEPYMKHLLAMHSLLTQSCSSLKHTVQL